MRKTFCALGAALVALAPSAHATAGACVTLADGTGDHRTPPAPQLAPLMPYTTGLDLVGIHAVADANAVTVTFSAAGPIDPAPGTNYEYVYNFENATHEYKLDAGIDGGAHLPLTGVYELFTVQKDASAGGGVGGVGGGSAGHSSNPRVTVNGWIDHATNQVTIQAPASAFGVTAFPAGTTWTTVEAGTGWGVGGTSGYYADELPAAPGLPLTAGDGTCA
jgi:hypothetical protein